MMDQERWHTLEPLLDQALDLPADERGRFLDGLRARSPALAEELASLLAQDEAGTAGGPLDGAPAGLWQVFQERSLAGSVLGAWTLERPLGEGGMGAVWLARRADGRFEGQAAVKLLHLALATSRGREGFRREGSALARLTHPGIARLLDAGVTSAGQPYLVLEHVDGLPIDAYAAAHGLGVPARLGLFLQVLAAVGHAHGNLILHRDLKPSNILVTRDAISGAPVAKLLDFGLAKLLDPEDGTGAPTGSRTARGWMTSEYAAPEQIRGEPTTARTDVYQLGVVLYELLAGKRPFAGTSAHEVESAVLASAPPAPSSAAGSGRARALRGDLDAITLRALEPDPDRRYPSVYAFAEDIRRHLAGYPVLARRQTTGYRLRRLARRHRWPLAAAAAVLLLTLTYAATVAADRARTARALAEATVGARRAEEMADFAVGLFEASDRGEAYADTVTARQLLARGALEARELSGDPALRAQMLDVIGRIHTTLGEYDLARPPLVEALAIRRKLYGDDNPDVATSLIDLAHASGSTTPDSAPVVMLREALAIRRRHFGERDPRTTDALYELATAAHMEDGRPGAHALLDDWVAAVSREPAQVTPARAEQLSEMASVLQISGRLPDAERLSRQALAMDRALYGDGHQRVGRELFILGSILDDAGRHAEAEAALRESIAVLRTAHQGGRAHLAFALRDLGYLLNHAGRWKEAEDTWREDAALYREMNTVRDPGYGNALLHLGRALSMLGRDAEAVPILRESLAIFDAHYASSSPMGALPRLYLGDALRKQGRLAGAERLLLAGYAAVHKETRFNHSARSFALQALAQLYQDEGRPADAARYLALRRP